MTLALDRWTMWLFANAIGIALFFYFAVKTWIEPELANEPGASGGEAFVWGLTALPIFLAFMVAQFVAGMIGHREFVRTGRKRGNLFVAITLALWVAAFVFDGLHHGS